MLSGDAVEKKVDGVVDEDEEVADRLRVAVHHVGAVFPVRLADQQDDARRDADEERERNRQTHQRRLPERGTS